MNDEPKPRRGPDSSFIVPHSSFLQERGMPADDSFDVTKLDFSHPVAGPEEIRAVNPHRFEMELLSGIVLVDPAKHFIVGYKDLTAGDFWVRGHMPGFPLLP